MSSIAEGWIRTADRLPIKADAHHQLVYAKQPELVPMLVSWEIVRDNPEVYPHWQSVPMCLRQIPEDGK
jgi:hypothetical protein